MVDRGPVEAVIDQLELEIRQLDGISFVGVGERAGVVLLEVGAEPGADVDALRQEAHRLATGHLDGEVVVEILEPGPVDAPRSDARVALTWAEEIPAGRVQIHLSHREHRVVTEVRGTALLDVATTVVAGLVQLGFSVPWVPLAVEELTDELGAGTLVLLTNPATGRTRRGLSAGRSPGEATARAVLSALNRFLQPAHLPGR